ncbi:MAG: hypothetical protein IMY76_08695 [Chloroflexi bacterium]|nr:hypothetical protein [Chloroflexota bacterium]
MAYHGAHIAAAAAAEKQRQLEEDEEEKMTKYSNDDMEKWEFKIVRSDSGAFRKPDVLAELVEEEALAGWEMLEKFDNKRIRFRRSIEDRKRDAMLPDYVDPYRTQYGSSPQVTAILIGVILLLLGVFLFGFFAFRRGGGLFAGELAPILVVLIGGIGVLAAVFAILRSRG